MIGVAVRNQDVGRVHLVCGHGRGRVVRLEERVHEQPGVALGELEGGGELDVQLPFLAGGEPLVLRQNGVLLAVGDTLVVGQGGRLAGLNPANGTVRWDAPIGITRGTNDVERLIDLVGPVSRVGASVCTRAFQAAARRARPMTPKNTKPANQRW